MKKSILAITTFAALSIMSFTITDTKWTLQMRIQKFLVHLN
jgi:hypothetical protein